MAGQESLYGEGHPATYDLDDSENPLYDPESKWYDPEAAERFQRAAKTLGSEAVRMIHIEPGEDGQNYPGENPPGQGAWIKEPSYHSKNSVDTRDS